MNAFASCLRWSQWAVYTHANIVRAVHSCCRFATEIPQNSLCMNCISSFLLREWPQTGVQTWYSENPTWPVHLLCTWGLFIVSKRLFERNQNSLVHSKPDTASLSLSYHCHHSFALLELLAQPGQSLFPFLEKCLLHSTRAARPMILVQPESRSDRA